MIDLFSLISDVLYKVQFNKNSHVAYCKKLNKLYLKVDAEEFINAFNLCLISPFKIGESNANVERTLDFAALFCINPTLEDKQNPENENNDTEMNPLLRGVFTFLLKNHQSNNSAVRFRICQFINKILTTMGDNAYVDTDLCNKMCECMMDRLKDKTATVRTQAVLALERLQEPSQTDCPIINALLFHLNNDPIPEVRKMILRRICRTTTTIPCILDRTSDIKDDVRHAAYLTLARVHMKSLSIKKRASVIKQGLSDKSPHVRQCVESVLLPRWLVSLDGDYLQLLHSFHVENYTKTCEDVLNVFFKKDDATEEQMLSFLKTECGLTDQLIPVTQLTPEKVFLWRCFVQYCRAKNLEEFVEVLVPDLTPFCAYIKSFHDTDSETNELNLTNGQQEFMLLQFLEIAKGYDFSDEMGRTELQHLVLNMIFNEDTKEESIPFLTDRLVELEPNTTSRMQILAERISELHEPIDETMSRIQSESFEKDRETIESNILELTLQWEKSIRKQDFAQAEECKESLVHLHVQLGKLPQLDQDSESGVSLLSKCLTIIYEMMQPPTITSLTPQLRSLMENFVTKFIAHDNLKVRNLALKCMAAFCCLDLEVAKVQILIFYKELVESNYEDATCPTSLRSIFDILLVFGLEPFGLADTLDDISAPSGEVGEMSTLLLTIIVKIIDDPTSMEMRTIAAEGFCKLALAGKIRSYTLLSKLLLTWFNPEFKTNEKMKQLLALFFTTFASNCDWALHTFVKAFIPTLDYLLHVDLESPLHAIDLYNLAKLMVQLTKRGINPKFEENVHNNLALILCNHILKDPLDDIVPILVRSLAQLDLTLDEEQCSQVSDLVAKIMEIVKEKMSQRSLLKFKQNLELLNVTASIKRSSVASTQSASKTQQLDNDISPNDSRVELEKIIEEMSSSQSVPSSPPRKQQRLLRAHRRPHESVIDSDDSEDRFPAKSACRSNKSCVQTVVPESDSEDISD